jgi:predicted metal-binding protein
MDPLPVETPLPQPRPIKPLWRTGVALVCKKCSGNKKSDLRRWLKRRIKHDGLHQELRVLGVGCLDVCPKSRVTVVVEQEGQPPTFLIVGTEEREALYAQLASAVPRPH